MATPPTLLGGLSPAEFLETYWQKKPLLIRGALPGFESPVSPDELAGLACEDDVTARLILEKGGDYPWQLRHGPFTEDDFAELPPTHWTLLVSEVDRWVPDVAALLDFFRFIPSWRIDDVMISYAPEEGGVGAHVDNYDVFLLQAKGHRRWQINHTPVLEENLIEDIDVSMLSDFVPEEDWVLAPGDMLYLPPRIAHYGVALDDCMTYSIGFRVPSHQDIVTGFLSHAVEQIDPLARYADPDLKPQMHPGEIGPAALARVRKVLQDLLGDEEAVSSWFGSFMTEPRRGRYPESAGDPVDAADIRRLIETGARLTRSPLTRMAYIRHADGATSLFVNGTEHDIPATLPMAAPLLTGDESLDRTTLFPALSNAAFAELLAELVNEGYLELTGR